MAMDQMEVHELLARMAKLNASLSAHRHDERENDHDEQEDSHSLLIAKITAMVVLFCASTICGSIPFLLNRWFKWTENSADARSAIVIRCLLYFGGGVLLCTTFLHLLPEVKENIDELQGEGLLPELPFPLAEFLTCMGFFAMFLIEEIIHTYIHRHKKTITADDTTAAFVRGQSIRESYLMKNGKNKSKNTSSDDEVNDNKIDKKDSESNSRLSVKDLILNDVENQKYEMPSAPDVAENNYHCDLQKQQNHMHSHSHSHSHDNHHSHLPMSADEDIIVSSLRGLLIVLALSLHELFEGLAVGLESSSSKVWIMLGAVSAHKLVLSFCVGVELIVNRTRLWLSIVYVMTFAFVSPLGIGIGIAVSHENSAASAIPSAILQGLATGTLLYVVFFEILSKERSGLRAYAAFLIGFCVMFGLQVATGHEHSHGGDHDGHEHSHSHTEGHHDHEHDSTTTSTQTLDEQLKILREVTKEFTAALTKKMD